MLIEDYTPAFAEFDYDNSYDEFGEFENSLDVEKEKPDFKVINMSTEQDLFTAISDNDLNISNSLTDALELYESQITMAESNNIPIKKKPPIE
jgi:hypothetical protein